jgi:hypothetical protein
MLDLNIYILWPLMGGAPDLPNFLYWLICKGQDNGRKWSRHHFTTFEGKDVEFFGRSGQDFAYPRFKKVVLMNCQLLRNQSTNRIRNLIEEREGQKAVFGGTYHVLGNVSYHKQERTWGRDAIFFLACYFWLPKKKKKLIKKRPINKQPNKQTNKQIVICDPSIWPFYPAGADHVPSSLFACSWQPPHYYYITYLDTDPNTFMWVDCQFRVVIIVYIKPT